MMQTIHNLESDVQVLSGLDKVFQGKQSQHNDDKKQKEFDDRNSAMFADIDF